MFFCGFFFVNLRLGCSFSFPLPCEEMGVWQKLSPSVFHNKRRCNYGNGKEEREREKKRILEALHSADMRDIVAPGMYTEL